MICITALAFYEGKATEISMVLVHAASAAEWVLTAMVYIYKILRRVESLSVVNSSYETFTITIIAAFS